MALSNHWKQARHPALLNFHCPIRPSYNLPRLNLSRTNAPVLPKVPGSAPRHRTRRAAAGEESILLIRLKSIGDILFTLPAVHKIRQSFPNAKITFLTSKENAPLIEGFADVDEVLTIDRASYHSRNPKAILGETFSLFLQLRRGQFSLVVDFQGYGETGLITWLSRAPNRWGSVYRTGRGWAYTRAVQRENLAHPANWNLSLLRQCGLPDKPVRNEFIVPDHALAEAAKFLADNGLDPAKPILFIQPFTSSERKAWPLENYLAVAAHWKQRGVQIIFGGGPTDSAKLAPAREAGFAVSAGVPLLVTAGLMKHSALVIGADTGLLHLAVALNKRVVMLMRSAKHTRFHPFQHENWMLVPAGEEWISSLTTAAVIETCQRAFAELT